jgi:glycosyltransferase involved in cell wall biosynthesis
LIVVNDYSEDESWEILTEYHKRDPRIKLFNNEDKGIIPALKLAFSKSIGNFITRMDADDIMASGKLELLKSNLIDDIDVVVGKVKYFSQNTLGKGYQRYADWLNALIDSGVFWKDVYRECVIPSPCWMMTRKKLISIGGFKDSRYPEDYDLCFRMYLKGMKVRGADKILHYWRDHPERSSRKLSVYLDPWFLDLKIHYFINKECGKEKQLVIWGAGKKGKFMVKQFLSRNLTLHWVSDNLNKQGKKIYGVEVENPSIIENLSNVIIAIPVSNRKEQVLIREFLEKNNKKEGYDFFFFA